MHTWERESIRQERWLSFWWQMWLFHKFGLSLGVRVGGTMPRQWMSAHSNGRASWLNDYNVGLPKLESHGPHWETWQNRNGRGRHGSLFTKQWKQNKTASRESDTWQSPLVSFLSMGEHELETMGWGEPTPKLTHALNNWTVKPLHWIWLWWGAGRPPSQRPSYEP